MRGFVVLQSAPGTLTLALSRRERGQDSPLYNKHLGLKFAPMEQVLPLAKGESEGVRNLRRAVLGGRHKTQGEKRAATAP